MQSVAGIILFYGIGFGMRATAGLTFCEFAATAVFTAETALCALWLKHFKFSPLEWIWRMFTYGKWFKIRK